MFSFHSGGLPGCMPPRKRSPGLCCSFPPAPCIYGLKNRMLPIIHSPLKYRSSRAWGCKAAMRAWWSFRWLSGCGRSTASFRSRHHGCRSRSLFRTCGEGCCSSARTRSPHHLCRIRLLHCRNGRRCRTLPILRSQHPQSTFQCLLRRISQPDCSFPIPRSHSR